MSRKSDSINVLEAKAFVLQHRMLRLSPEEILRAAAETRWIASREDRAWGRIPHTPTIRRLIKRMVTGASHG